MSEMSLNLLPSRAKFQASKILWSSRVNKFMVGLVAVWLLAVVIIVGLLVWTNVVKNQKETKLANTTSEFLNFDDTIKNSQRLKYKAKLVGEVLSDRFEYSKAFNGASSFFPERITMTKFLLGDDRVLKLEGTAKDIDLELVETQVRSVNAGVSEIYKKARITSLVWAEGYWKFSVEVNL